MCSVLNFRVKGVNNLRVADSSVMRNVPSANTNAASMMIGEKAADIIKMSWRSKYGLNSTSYGSQACNCNWFYQFLLSAVFLITFIE